jgi:hypothetical protein
MRIASSLLLVAALALATPDPAAAQAEAVGGALLVRDAGDQLLGRAVGVPDGQRVTVAMSVDGELVFLHVARNSLLATAPVYFTAPGCAGASYFEAPGCEEALVAPSGYDAADGSLYTPSTTIGTERPIVSLLGEAGACMETPGFQLPRGCEALRHAGALAGFTPPFAATPSTGILCNGFESGDTSCWSSTGGPGPRSPTP